MYVYSVPRVRIPLSPPTIKWPPHGGLFCWRRKKWILEALVRQIAPAIWTEGRSPDGRSPSAAVGGRTSQSLSLRQHLGCPRMGCWRRKKWILEALVRQIAFKQFGPQSDLRIAKARIYVGANPSHKLRQQFGRKDAVLTGEARVRPLVAARVIWVQQAQRAAVRLMKKLRAVKRRAVIPLAMFVQHR